MNDIIILKKAAEMWEEAFPSGNGKMGAMVFGRTETERIALNIDELWSGYGKEKVRKNSYEVLKEIRTKIIKGQGISAEQQLKESFLNEWNESYLPLGDLYFRFRDGGDVTDYRRILEMETGTAVCEYKRNGKAVKTEVFCPVNPQAIMIKISSESDLDMEFWMDSVLKHEKKTGNQQFWIWGTAPSLVQPNYYECDSPIQYMDDHKGMGYCAVLNVEAGNGRISEEGGRICVSGSREIVCCICAATGYDMENGTIGKSPEAVNNSCKKNLKKIILKKAGEIQSEHRKEFSALYNRMRIKLSEGENLLPTDERLAHFADNHEDQGLIELFFNFGRYLLISSSREGTMPANLQGIWNDKIRAPWSSNYTTNINLQMNYWLAEKANLSEMHMPLFEFLRRCMKNGQVTAREQFGCRGWVANHNIDCWYQTSPVGTLAEKSSAKYGYFPIASGWLCLHIWEHYQYTKDKQFLERYYPVLKESALFYVDYLQEIDETYVTVPSTSPENLYYDREGKSCALSIGSTADMAVIRMLFYSTQEAAEILEDDPDFAYILRTMAERIPDYKIGNDGSLQEWREDYREVYPDHRHLSHMIGLYPGNELVSREELYSACARTLEKRTAEGTAWSKSWKACLWARLKNGDKAYGQLCGLLRPYDSTRILYTDSGCLDNLFSTPPFQIDANLGMPAAIMEMLVQDYNGKLELLPAVPKKWKSGSVEGMKIAGGHVLSFIWNDHKVTNITIKGQITEEFQVYFNGNIKRVQLQECEITNITAE